MRSMSGSFNPYVLRIVLALAALHLCTTDAEKSNWYALAISHYSAAIRLARPHIAAQGSSHGEAVFRISDFNALFAFVQPSLRTLSGDKGGDRDYPSDLFD